MLVIAKKLRHRYYGNRQYEKQVRVGNMPAKAVFFDRDGCLIVDKHYLHDPEQLDYFPDTFSALKELKTHGYKIFIVTNQSGIGRGFFSLDQMHAVHDKMTQDFRDHDIEINEIVFCPHAPDDNCECRKPHPTLINDLCQKYHLDKKNCFMLGDKISDAECGKNAAINGCLIHNSSSDYPCFSSLTDFVKFVLTF